MPRSSGCAPAASDRPTGGCPPCEIGGVRVAPGARPAVERAPPSSARPVERDWVERVDGGRVPARARVGRRGPARAAPRRSDDRGHGRGALTVVDVVGVRRGGGGRWRQRGLGVVGGRRLDVHDVAGIDHAEPPGRGDDALGRVELRQLQAGAAWTPAAGWRSGRSGGRGGPGPAPATPGTRRRRTRPRTARSPSACPTRPSRLPDRRAVARPEKRVDGGSAERSATGREARRPTASSSIRAAAWARSGLTASPSRSNRVVGGAEPGALGPSVGAPARRDQRSSRPA